MGMASEDWTARGEAYSEAAEHLKLAWTEDDKERRQGDIVAKKLMAESERCHRRAANLELDPRTPEYGVAP